MLNQTAYPPPIAMIDVAPSTDPERLTKPWSTWTIYQPKSNFVLFMSKESLPFVNIKSSHKKLNSGEPHSKKLQVCNEVYTSSFFIKIEFSNNSNKNILNKKCLYKLQNEIFQII